MRRSRAKALSVNYKVYKRLKSIPAKDLRSLKRLTYGLDGSMLYILNQDIGYPSYLFAVICYQKSKILGWVCVSRCKTKVRVRPAKGPSYTKKINTSYHLDIYIRTNFRRRGIGTQLVERAKKELKRSYKRLPRKKIDIVRYCEPSFFRSVGL